MEIDKIRLYLFNLGNPCTQVPFTHSNPSNVERKANGIDKYDRIIDTPINLDVSTSAEGRLPPSTTHLPYRKSNSVQHASEFSDTPKERSLSVTTQMLGKLQEVEIKRFLTGLGNLTKTGDFQNIESSAIQKRTYLKENETLKYHSTSNAITTQDSYHSSEYSNMDTRIMPRQPKRFMNKSCAV